MTNCKAVYTGSIPVGAFDSSAVCSVSARKRLANVSRKLLPVALTVALMAACPNPAWGARTYLPYPLVLRESRYLAERECNAEEGACIGWEATCERIARRRINCELAWFYPWLFEPETGQELRCVETLYWGLGRGGFLALRGQSGVACEPVAV